MNKHTPHQHGHETDAHAGHGSHGEDGTAPAEHRSLNRSIDTLEFSARRECVEAGIRVVRAERESIRELLET